jgi:predicted CXXCH cytochrome family protein
MRGLDAGARVALNATRGARSRTPMKRGRSKGPRRVHALVLLALVVPGCATQPQAPAEPRYVTSAACASCHPSQYAAWSGSDHERAMQMATDSTVLGDFADASFAQFGVTTRFFRRNDGFFVNTEGPDSALADFEVRYTFGVRPLQQYLIELPRGRLQALPIAWDTRRGRWFSLYPGERIGPGDPLHWTGPYLNWNAQCAACHSTALRKNYDFETDAYATRWAELSVGCQACHGTGAAHVAWAGRQTMASRRDRDPGFPVKLRDSNNRTEVETCAPCHSRRQQIADAPEPGQPFLDDFIPSRLEEGLYFPDGQILDEVYVYGSFTQSKMYAAGVRCTDCHDPHSLRLVAEGNALCTRCHGETPDPRFPMLKAGRYDSPEHHFHAPGTPGAMCVDCHMPTRTYMVVDPRRDHGFKVPHPELSASLGTPNPCSTCHGKSSEWAAAEIRRRRGTPVPGEPVGVAFAGGRARAPKAVLALRQIAADSNTPAIVRATALDLLHDYGTGAGADEEVALRDPEPLVRVAAVRGAESMEPRRRLVLLTPLLDDSFRAIRMEAARALATVPRELFGPAQTAAFDRALGEYVAAQEFSSDTPAGLLNLGLVHEAQGRDSLAESSYRAALSKDRTYRPARFNLVHLYNRTQRNPAAERTLREGLAWTPDDGEMRYSLGLLLAEDARYVESAAELGRAAALFPDRARVALNHGLALQHLGRMNEAERELRRALVLEATNPDVLEALSVLHLQERRWDEAKRDAERILDIDPADPRGRRLIEQAEAGRHASTGATRRTLIPPRKSTRDE